MCNAWVKVQVLFPNDADAEVIKLLPKPFRKCFFYFYNIVGFTLFVVISVSRFLFLPIVP